MSGSPAVVLDKVTKIYERPGRRGLVRAALGVGGPARDGAHALQDVTHTVARGGSLGIVGHNGAGKSTLVKILAGVTEPTSGRAVVNGRVASLLDSGLGLHGDLTGEENLGFASVLQGATPREARRVSAAVVEFAGLRDFMDMPVRQYSSGMRARLSFAIACSVSADILVLDEGLAAGDADFRRRAMDRLLELRDRGTTFVFVSHWLKGLEDLAEEVICLEQGRIVDRGAPSDVLSRYTGGEGGGDVAAGDGRVSVRAAWTDPPEIDPLASLTVHATLRVTAAVPGAQVRLRIGTTSGRRALVEIEIPDASRLVRESPGEYELAGHLESFPMGPGAYVATVSVVDPVAESVLSRARTPFTVAGAATPSTQLGLVPEWTVRAVPHRADEPRVR